MWVDRTLSADACTAVNSERLEIIVNNKKKKKTNQTLARHTRIMFLQEISTRLALIAVL